MKSNTKNVKLGVCNIIFGGVNLGFTKGGVEVSVKTDTHKTEVDQFGKTPINEFLMGRDVNVKAPLAETTLENLVATMPGAVLTSVGGTVATGSITITTNPVTNDTIVVNGKTITFKTVAAADDEVTIGAAAASTAVNLAAALNASTDPLVAAAVYSVAGAIVTAKYGPAIVGGTAGVPGVEGNSFTLSAGTAGAKVTLSGATLTGGTEPTSKRVDVSVGASLELLSIAKELRLHPVSKPEGDQSEDFVIPRAATAGALTFAYKLEDERVFSVEFNGYPDQNGKLFHIGA